MRRVSLDDRYRLEEGVVYLSGLQALVRLPLDQQRRDRRAGLRIGTFISGYPGSPIAGYDLALRGAREVLATYDILHVPGANEELAATAISGTQMLDQYPHSRVDGVVALWYGKGPGVDRSGDALKHGNFAGTSRHGAVVLLSGDDHEAKSSTMPFQDDYAFMSAGIPVLYPASTCEFLELGLHAIALSRYSGCWVAMKLVNALADGGETVAVRPDSPAIVVPELTIDGRPFQKSTDFRFFPGLTIETERRLHYERHRAVVAYARANHLDRIVTSSLHDRIGIVTAGKSYADTRAALADLGVGDDEGIRLLRLGLTYPVDAERVREFASGLDEIIVVEEKRGFIEAQVKDALAGRGAGVHVVGKQDEHGAALFPIQGGMDADLVAERLGRRLLAVFPGHGGIAARLAALDDVRRRRYPSHDGRTPNYCSGCPHNISTRLLDGQVAWGSPGCHSFASIIEQPERHIVSMTQLGGEGLPWIGLAPFTDRTHIVQNVGDGSLFHSSYLNIRFAVAAGVNITFKILYNGFVANTGAQALVGGKTIPELTRLLEIEGVKRTALLTKDPGSYRNAPLAGNVRVCGIDEQDEVLGELEHLGGVTVLIYDGLCANERRRRQKRGTLAVADRFVVINEAVCEGCGDCGRLTNCMSLHPVETEFGRKTRIHASSCNQDYSCLGGECPSFVTIDTKPGTAYRRPMPPELGAHEVAEPPLREELDHPFHVYLPGVGGTGILTLNAMLCYAALIDGLQAKSYDQTGAAQKWGPVLSSLVIAPQGQPLWSNTVGAARADLYLAFDAMAASTGVNLDRCDPVRTAAVVNTTLLPTGEMVRQVEVSPDVAAMTRTIVGRTDPSRAVTVEARRLAEALFGDYMATNVLMLGVACQAGLLPLSAPAIEAAIELNGVDVRQNVQAFRYGRLWFADPSRVSSMVDRPVLSADDEERERRARLPPRDRAAYAGYLDRLRDLDDETRRMAAIRVAELIAYQDARYPGPYVNLVLRVAERERTLTGRTGALTRAVVRYLYKLMAYKDEYEVARLQLDPAFLDATRAQFASPSRLAFHFHPPLLRATGLKRKLEFGQAFAPVLGLLRGMRRLRGTSLDLFGYAQVRREERRLIGWYRALVESLLQDLTAESLEGAIELASLPDGIRGFEGIKLANIRATEQRAAALSAAWTAGRGSRGSSGSALSGQTASR